jgi:hypothetical protein
VTDDSRSFVEEARRAKLDELRAAGIEPFGYAFHRTSTAASAVAARQRLATAETPRAPSELSRP